MNNSQSQPTSNIVQEYKPTDILTCGRGWKLTFDHEGNQIFRQIIESHMDAYMELSANQKERTLFFSAVNKELKAYGCRFLKRLSKDDPHHHSIGGGGRSGNWLVLDNNKTRCKISHAFRDKLHRNQVNTRTMAIKRKLESEESVGEEGKRKFEGGMSVLEVGSDPPERQLDSKAKHTKITKPHVACSKIYAMEDLPPQRAQQEVLVDSSIDFSLFSGEEETSSWNGEVDFPWLQEEPSVGSCEERLFNWLLNL